MGRGQTETTLPHAAEPGPRGLIWLTGKQRDRREQLSYPTRTLLVVGGIPGAGKSWLCARLSGAAVLDIDDFWQDGLDGRRSMRGFDQRSFLAAIDASLASGVPLAVQLTALQRNVRHDLCRRAEKAGYHPHLLMVDVDAETAIAAQQERSRRVPADVIRSYARSWSALKDEIAADGFLRREHYASVAVLDRTASSSLAISFERR